MTRILIVEDEPVIVASLSEDCARQGYETAVATDGEQAIALGTSGGWDVILLDVMLPKVDGFDVCAALRRAGVEAAIIMLTARTAEAEKVLGLDSGADDYVTKPFSLRELRARIRAQVRRRTKTTTGIVRVGACEVDLDRALVKRDGLPVDVTAQEFKLLCAFLRNPARVLSREQIIEAAWGPNFAISDRAVDTHVYNLRQKIEPVPERPAHLLAVRGLGYRFELEP